MGGSFGEPFEDVHDEPVTRAAGAARFGRHSQTDDVDFEDIEGYEDYDDYDQDGYADEPSAYASELEDDRGGVLAAGAMGASVADDGAARAGAGTVSSSAATGSGAALAGGATAVSSVPKRGLAMILIAVAILLGLWGVYAMTQSGKDDGDTAVQEQQNQQQDQGGRTPGDKSRYPNTGSPTNPANPTEGTNQDSADKKDAADNNAANKERMTAENETVNVFNNSTVPNLAADVSGALEGQGARIGEVGNITEAQAVLTENTVFFDPATPGAEERAKALAERVGGVAKPNDGTVPENAANPGSLTLVLTGPVSF